MKRLASLVLLCLSGCIGGMPSGDPLEGPAPIDLLGITIVIPVPPFAILADAACATVIEPGRAVTAGHAAGVATTGFSTVRAPIMDLAYFPTSKGTPLPIAEPQLGEPITAYGNSLLGGFRMARGTVLLMHIKIVHPDGSDVGDGFAFDAPVGPGFSGCPVLNASGELVGVTTTTIRISDGPLKDRDVAFGYRASDVLQVAQ